MRPLIRQRLLLGLVAIIDGLEEVGVSQEVGIKAIEPRELGHAKYLLPNTGPGVLSDPFGRIRRDLDFTSRASKQIPPFFIIELIHALKYFNCQHQREQQFVFLEK
jgi:hypothetical protein